MKKEDIEEIENEESDENIKGVDFTDAMLSFVEPNFMENVMEDLKKQLGIDSFDELYLEEEDEDEEDEDNEK